MLAFQERYGSEAGCIEALARLRWPHGYVCAACGAPSRQRPPPLSWAHELGGFVRAAVRPGSRLVSDDFKGYAGLRGTDRHPPVVQGDGKNAERLLPIVHVPFSDVKTWLNGTYHGVSAKHLARYAREWNDRFNRRTRIADPATPCSSAPWPDRPSPTGSRSTVYNLRARYLP